jgi:hypothetical protein
VGSLEGPAEGLLGLVTDAAGDRGHAQVGALEEVAGDVHAPVGEIPDRREAEAAAEPLVHHGHRHVGGSGKLGDRPLAAGVSVHARDGGGDHRVVEAAQPAALGRWRTGEVQLEHLTEQQLGHVGRRLEPVHRDLQGLLQCVVDASPDEQARRARRRTDDEHGRQGT